MIELSPSGGDDSWQIQMAINDGGTFDLGPGIFQLSGSLSVLKSIKCRGAGKNATFLRPPPGRPAIVITVPGEGYNTLFEDFGILYSSFQSGTSAIIVSAAAGHEHTGFEARSLYIGNAGFGINFAKASYWCLTGTHIQNSTNAAVLVRNGNNGDSGDAVISGSWFTNPSITSGSAIGVQQFSGGGLKIIGTKFNLFNQAVQVSLDANVHTCNLIMQGCSAEAVGFANPNAPVLLQNVTNSGSFSNVVISGNQFNGWGYNHGQVAYDGLINVVNNTGWATQIAVGPNVIT